MKNYRKLKTSWRPIWFQIIIQTPHGISRHFGLVLRFTGKTAKSTNDAKDFMWNKDLVWSHCLPCAKKWWEN
jgi:hypothetical protein